MYCFCQLLTGSLAEIAEEDEAFDQFSFTPDKGDSLKS